MSALPSIPICLVFAGHDPTGGAGLQADIESIISMGAHAVTVATASTVQDTQDVHRVQAVATDLLIEQARTLLDDVKISAVKIGLVPSAQVAEAIHGVLLDMPGVPVVLDPVVHAGGGHVLQDEGTAEAIKALLFPQTMILTPNGPEARFYASNADTLDACGMSLLESGSEYILISGGHEPGQEIVNKLYGNNRCLEQFRWERIPGEFHGTGCTLSASIAGLLAHGREPLSAVREAQQYTWETLKHASRIGNGQQIPNRTYWSSKNS